MEKYLGVYGLIKEYEDKQFELSVRPRVVSLLEEYNDNQIEQDIEYNNYILCKMTDFIDEVSFNENMISLDLLSSDFFTSYREIIDFLLEKKDKISEISKWDEMLMIAYNLFIHYSKGNFNSLKSYKNLINSNISKSLDKEGIDIFYINFNDDFYDELKESLINFVKILNNHLIMKKSSFK